MTAEFASLFPFEEKELYGARVRKYETGGLQYEVKGLRDGYGTNTRLGMVVTRKGDVYLSMDEIDSGRPNISIRFNHTTDGSTMTPYMAERLTRIPRSLFEERGLCLPDEPEFKVDSLQDKLKVVRSDNSLQGFVGGIQGDGDHNTSMNLVVGEEGDVGITLIQLPKGIVGYRSLNMTFPSSPAGAFYSGILHEFREATHDLIFSKNNSTG
jgi:hypothetical protein